MESYLNYLFYDVQSPSFQQNKELLLFRFLLESIIIYIKKKKGKWKNSIFTTELLKGELLLGKPKNDQQLATRIAWIIPIWLLWLNRSLLTKVLMNK